jgi:hypothetical protein
MAYFPTPPNLKSWLRNWLQRLLHGARLAAAHGRRSLVVEVTVAQNGSGDYRTIAIALAAAPKSKKKARSSYTIRIREGTYIEWQSHRGCRRGSAPPSEPPSSTYKTM